MSFDFRFYASLFLRRLPVMLALLLVCSGISLVSALKLPAVYATSARLLVEEAQIDLAPNGTQGNDGAEQLQVIEQQLMTRANLIDIAHKLNVFENIAEMTPDSVVGAMTKATTIRRQSGRDQATLMTISFEGRSPRVVAAVVNEYVTLILDASSKARLSRAEGTLTFFEQEVQRLSEDLDLQSARIVAFKNANATALPDDLEYRMNRQSLLQERLGRLESDRAAMAAQRNDVVTVFQATGQVRPEAEAPLTPDQEQLAVLKRELDQARAIYAETNPKVTMLKTRVARLEASIASTVPAAPEGPEPASLLDVTLAQIDSRIAALDTEIAAANAELQTLEASIAATSANAITLGALERDYANIQERYNAAVNNLNAARMSERIETAAKGERVTVIENAAVPQVPSGPDRRKIAAMGIGLGLGLAGGWFMLLEVLNRTIRQPAELKGRFGILPIATIPYMESRRDRLWRRGILVAASLAVLTGVPAALWYTDTYYMPLETLAAKVMVRLGVS